MENLRRAVEIIFSNWTGLEMAVQNFGSRDCVSAVVDIIDNAVLAIERVIKGISTSLERHEMIDYLVTVLDEQFDTLCEDESPEEVVDLMQKVLLCILRGDDPLDIPEIKCLSITRNWIPFEKPRLMPIRKALHDVAEERTEEAAVYVGSGVAADLDDSGEIADVEDCIESEDEPADNEEHRSEHLEGAVPLSTGTLTGECTHDLQNAARGTGQVRKSEECTSEEGVSVENRMSSRKKKKCHRFVMEDPRPEDVEMAVPEGEVDEDDEGGWIDVTRKRH